MKKVVVFVRTLVCSILAIVLLSSSTVVYAKSCEHSYGDTDVCKKCGNIRVHSFDYSIPFYTVKENVPIWSSPTKNSKLIEEVAEQDTEIAIDGILRNKYGNIWLKVASKNQYIFIDNLYIDFLVLSLRNFQQIFYYHDDFEIEIIEFCNFVKEKGRADYKAWLDPSSKGIEYKVRIGNDYYTMTAEELGNIHYGYLGRAVGIGANILLYAGGGVNVYGEVTQLPIDIVDILNKCINSYCDDSADAENVKKGIDYFDTGTFKWE